MEENESVGTESDGSEGSSSEASSTETTTGESAQASAPKEQEIDWGKAFEHPRFKELVTQKNDALSKYQDIESRYKTLENQWSQFQSSQPKAQTETDQLIEDLKKIDPRLANVIASQQKEAQAAQSLQARLDQFEKQSQEQQRNQTVQTAVSRINQMHETNKVSPELKTMINDKLDLLYIQGKLNLQNLDQLYKDQFDGFKKYEDALTRSIRESYVKDKTKDASVPTSVPKGSPAKAAQKQLNVPRDKEELKSAIVKSYLKEQAANREATNN